jgi:hypothetical protein
LLNQNIEVVGSPSAGGGHQLSTGRSSSFGATTGIGAGEKAACLELPVEVGPADLPVAEDVLEMLRAFACLGSLGKLAQIGDLGQVEAGQIVDQVCEVGAAGGVGHESSSDLGEIDDFVSAATSLLIRGIISSTC